MTHFAALLPAYLSWHGDDVQTEHLLETLMITCSNRLTRTLCQLAARDAHRAKSLQDRIGQLPDDALMRVLVAPESSYRLGYRGGEALNETARFIESAVSAEERRGGPRPALETPCWSALGDLCFASTVDRAYIAPRVDGIVVDFESPWVLGELPHISGQAEPISRAHRVTALARIGAAIRLVNAASVRAAVAMRSFTQVIVVRSDPSQPQFYTSASSTLCLGRTVLRNPFVARATPSEVADGLVHEAIHCICDLTEVHDGRWVVCGGDDYHIRIASPWTERQLDIHTYLQACWVWYGLWHFWAQAIETEAIPVEDGLRCLGRAYRGFADGAAVTRLTPHRAAVDGPVLEALEDGQARLLNRMSIWESEIERSLDDRVNY